MSTNPEAPRNQVTLHIRRTASVSDGNGNTYGIMEVSPDESDPAILLAIRIGATGKRYGHTARVGSTITVEGLDLAVTELKTAEPASATLIGTVPSGPAQ